MFPWNRREVYLGFSEKEFNEVRDILAANHILYDTRLINHHSNEGRTRGTMGSFGLNTAYETQYYVYVKKQDYEKSKFLLKNK